MEDKMISTASQLEVAEGGGAEAERGGDAVVVGPASVELTEKRRRGRPKKFNFVASTPPAFPSYEKRGRGRPRGSGRLQLLASLGGFLAETAGGSFIPHVVIVDAGEDIVRKLLYFAQKGRRAICILSAIGCVSSVIIRQPGSSDGILRYEGRFAIVSLSGSFIFTGINCKNGMLSVSLAKPDGKVFGGVVAGSLIACAPIQLIIGSFKQNINISKELKLIRQSAESSTAAYNDNGDSETEKTSTQTGSAAIDGGEENCNTQTSRAFESTNEQPHPISSQGKSSTPPQI